MPNVCAMKNCKSNGRDNKTRSFYRFPIDEERCITWIEACGRPDLKNFLAEFLHQNTHVCDLHFKPSDRNRVKLKVGATPFPWYQTPKETKSTQTDLKICQTSESDTDVELDPSPSTAADRKLNPKGKGSRKKLQLLKLQEKLRRMQENKCGLNPELFKLIDVQTEIHKLSKEKRCTEKLQLYTLGLYLACPTTYKLIRGLLTLPSQTKLRRIDLEIDPVMNCRVIYYLKIKISSYKDTDKICTVCLKKMPLKRFLFYHINRDKVIGFRNVNGEEIMDPATDVYVLIARGLNAKWEQPLAYCFPGENEGSANIDPWLDSVLNTIMDIGYDVVAVVVDHEDLYDHMRNRIQSFTQPYFHANSELKKIYCIFDLPQLIISLRNTLMTYKLQFHDDDKSLVIADWGTIEDLYSETNNDNKCPKLTKSHIYPNESEKKELKYAAEVFSKTVSEALALESKKYAEYDNRKRGTQKLTALVNDVFDILNSSALKHHNKCKNAFTGEPHQMKAIRQFMEFLTSVKPFKELDVNDTSFNCIYGLRISIMSFSIILRDLLPMGINSLVTHRFNLDAVDRLFNTVKQKSKTKKPTAVEFYKHFRKSFMVELTRSPRTINRTDNVLHLLSRIDFKQITRSKMRSDDFKKTIEVETVDYRFELPTSNTFHYICWYLLKKCCEVHNLSCEQLRRFLYTNVVSVNWNTYTWHTYFEPPKVFIDFVKNLDELFNKSFGYRLDVGLGTGILLLLKSLHFDLICACFPINYMRRLFVRLRIFNIIRYNNRRLSDEAHRFSNTDHYNVDIL